MSDLVSVASNAVASYQRALGTISNNIANSATEGYSRQAVVLQANPVAKVGTVYLGTGVAIEAIKRKYDTFVESNLRNSTSDLTSQEPMVNYANRVIDIMGSTSMGLSGALDQFFNAARDLSSDPGSTVMRSSFVKDSKNLAARFGELSSQLDLVQRETDEAVNGYVKSMNTIFSQLAVVNVQMTKQKSADAQPADLLDQRDLLLKELAGYAKINTFFAENGSVTVSLGPTITRSVAVNGVNFVRIGTQFNSAAPEKVSLVLDPFGKPEPLPGLSGGKLSGLLSFREQVLNSSRASLDTLAQVFVKETNAVHEGGIDAYGNAGAALFSIEKKPLGAAGTVKVAFEDALRVAAAAQFRVIEAANNTGGSDASIAYTNPLLTGPTTLTSVLQNNPSDASAVSFVASVGKPFTGVATIANGLQDVSLLMGEPDPGQHLQVFTRDGRQLVGASINSDLQSLLIKPENGFEVNAGYSSAYLNVAGTGSYKNLQVFYGAKAEVGKQMRWNLAEADPTKHSPLSATDLPAELKSTRIQTGATSIASGLFTLNGTSLPALSTTPSIQANNIANWINTANTTAVAKVQGASGATTEVASVTFPALTTGQTFTLAGITITASGSVAATDLASAFANKAVTNTVSAGTNFTVSGTLTGYGTGGATGSVVQFTSSNPNSIVADLVATGNNASSVVVSITTQGAAAATTESNVVTFKALRPNNSVTVNGLTFTARVNMTANEVASAFANITSGTTSADLTLANPIAASLGKYSGTFTAGFSTGVPTASGTVTATSTTANANVTDITVNDAKIDGIAATASNEIIILAKNINLAQPLSITQTGVTSPVTTVIADGAAALASASALVTAINNKSAITKVIAKLNDEGNLILTNAEGFEGQDIAIATTALPNALGLTPQTYGGIVTLTRPLTSGVDTPIQLGFGTGTPADLIKIGFKTGAYIKGAANEDLLVFLTGSGDAKISATYTGAAIDAKQALRQAPLEVRFDSATRFTIVDTKTNTKVAERVFDPLQLEPAFVFQGVQISFSSPPKAGDIFTIDGNKDGTGNNENMLKMIDLESKPAMGGGKTFAAAYIDNVNDMGNIARQASIAQSALQVVYNQAESARDKVSGVNLDEEAADLIRFQQAYQAAAKILQVSSQLFDSVLQVR